MQAPRYIRSLHAIALLTAAAMFPLIFMGGLVTSHGAGMSVPDWLRCSPAQIPFDVTDAERRFGRP